MTGGGVDIVVASARAVPGLVLPPRRAVISIATPGNPRAVLPAGVRADEALFLAFDDIDTDMVFTNAGWRHLDEAGRDRYTLFDAALGARVLRFVLPRATALDAIVCQCEMGGSRSAGLAAALGRILTGSADAVFRNPAYTPNLRVYRATLAAAEALGALRPVRIGEA